MQDKIMILRHQNFNDFFVGRSMYVYDNQNDFSHINIVMEVDVNFLEKIITELLGFGFNEIIKKTKYGNYNPEDTSTDTDDLDIFVESARIDQEDNEFYYKTYTTHQLFKNNSDGGYVDIFTYIKGKTVRLYFTFSYKFNDHYLKIIEDLEEKYRYAPKKDDSDFSYFNVISYNHSFYLLERKIKTPKIKDEYYTNLDIDRLIKSLSDHGSGIYIFSGLPGTGKTTLIKYIISKMKKKVCYLPTSLLNLFGDPGFQGFLDRLSDSILIIEDCETLIKSRKNSANYDISTLLNLGDGILGESLNIKTILTYNVSDDVDDAILRKGRCLFKHHFEELEPDVATKISKEIGNNKTYNIKVNLAEIFNPEDGDYSVKNTKIGFIK